MEHLEALAIKSLQSLRLRIAGTPALATEMTNGLGICTGSYSVKMRMRFHNESFFRA